MNIEKRLILQIGFFFGWLLVFPVYGPLLIKLGDIKSANTSDLATYFLVAHAATFFIGGWLFPQLVSKKNNPLWSLISLSLCLLSSLTFFLIPSEYWSIPTVITGISAVLFIFQWGLRFSSYVPSDRRIHVMAKGMILANIFYGLSIA